LTLRESSPGLLVAEQGWDFDTVARSLKEIDRSLVLQYRAPFYVVVKIVNDHEAPVVFTWMTRKGEPLPLSSGLVEEFKRHRPDAPNQGPSIDERNAAHLAALEADRERESEAIIDDHRARVERGRVSVSLAHHDRRPEWAKKHRGRAVR
jgi:hypothetical protein